MCMSVSKGGQLWGKMGQGKEGKDFVLFGVIWAVLFCFRLGFWWVLFVGWLCCC